MDQPNIEKMKAERDIEGLIEALKHEWSSIRAKAIEALGEIRDERAVEPLTKALWDKDEQLSIQWKAAEALGKIGHAGAVKTLIYRLGLGQRSTVLAERYESVRAGAAEALGKIGDARAVEPLILALLNDTSGSVRANAAWALGEIGDERAVEPLTRLLGSYEHGGISEEDVKEALRKIEARKG